ncbi:MAG: RNA 2',3'-cyclic phosphodiesterase [Terriglobales bacterium]|jgi:2'-5' RNA ligase
MRIFIGIDLDDEIRAKMSRFLEGVSGFAPEARWVRPESLHITLKFVGEQKPEQVEAITQRLRRVESSRFEIRVSGYGFFPTAKSPRVFWIGIHAGPQLAQLASDIDAVVAGLGIPREEREFSPHLTLARAGGRPGVRSRIKSGDPKWRGGDGPNSIFAVLQKRLAAMSEPDLGRMAADNFILYQSQLSPMGSKYTRLERFPLRADESRGHIT